MVLNIQKQENLLLKFTALMNFEQDSLTLVVMDLFFLLQCSCFLHNGKGSVCFTIVFYTVCSDAVYFQKT